MKAEVPVASIVGRDFELHGEGRYLRAVEHNSLVVDTQKNKFYWNSAGISGTGMDWLIKVMGLSYADAYKVIEDLTGTPLRKNLDLLYEPSYPYPALLDAFYNRGKSERSYWYNRGYTDETIEHFKLGYTGNEYVVPVLHEGVLRNFQCRTVDKRIWMWTPGLGTLPFNFAALVGTDWCIITESPVDAILASQYGYPAISIMANALRWPREYQRYMVDIERVVLAFDNDVAGQRGVRKVYRNFSGYVLALDWEGYPEKADVGDVLKAGGREEFDKLLRKALPAQAYKAQTALNFYRRIREDSNVHSRG